MECQVTWAHRVKLHCQGDHTANTTEQIVRSRYLGLSQAVSRAPAAPAPAAEDEEEYEPDFEPEDAEQVVNRLDGLPPTDLPPQSGPTDALAPYKLPEAPPLSAQEVQRYGDQTVHRAFGMLSSVDEAARTKVTKSGFNRLAATDYGRDAWVTILSRVATRANAGLGDSESGVKDEFAVKSDRTGLSIGDSVREGLYNYIIHDWKKRIDVAISWLNEEWYNDNVLAQSSENSLKNGHATNRFEGNYQRCALRMFDGILGFIEHTDKILLRFLSEIPALDHDILSRLKIMARDPERIDLACSALQYLYMFRPPVRTIVVDTLVEMWQENDRAKPSARKLLLRWRPEVLGEEGSATPTVKMEIDGQFAKESANGALEVKAAS
jgi:symplekin